ncbi:hypothetical protein GCM10025869_17040 [Homoserinibacter gongjuensis]|uniref:Uncharacterized protein n=1 Tax=Homoserinibacter gongjuensis TaxID=1162968 RepID=A0ABQ6JV61_9MICO|nr:hypothetical protein GCM10025869_17040 [Homoserinibacter gongjuensis]
MASLTAPALLAGAFGDSRDAPGVLVAAAVEHDRVDARLLGALGDELADLLRLGGLVTVEGAQVHLERRRGCHGVALGVVDDLHEDVAGRTGDDETRTLGGADDALAQARVTTVALRRLADASHDHLPAFPALRRTTSPAYRTPLPL